MVTGCNMRWIIHSSPPATIANGARRHCVLCNGRSALGASLPIPDAVLTRRARSEPALPLRLVHLGTLLARHVLVERPCRRDQCIKFRVWCCFQYLHHPHTASLGTSMGHSLTRLWRSAASMSPRRSAAIDATRLREMIIRSSSVGCGGVSGGSGGISVSFILAERVGFEPTGPR